tara:strand:+ start:231 stop:797 length:567 start_codon:yes stop_codon:yes gene_type:complete
MKKIYLLSYNLISFLLWSYVFVHVLISPFIFFQDINFILKIVQTLAVLDVCHSYLGLSSSFKLPAIMQTATRLLFTWLILGKYEVTTIGWVPLMVVGSWSLIEVVRYLYYFLKIKSEEEREIPYILVWLRYRLFFVLYPLGFAGEVACLYKTNIVEGGWTLLFIPYFLGLLFMMKHMHELGKKKLKRS